jgi:uncharacterized protein (TIGR00255 family)
MDVIRLIASMTGFGQANRSFAGYKVFIEIKSVNHRYFEVSIRMPKEWARYEDSLKKSLQQTLKRGRVEVYITAEREAGMAQAISVNWPLADGYMDAVEQIRVRYGFTERLSLTDILQLPELIHFSEERSELDATFEQELLSGFEEAIQELSRMRQVEGSFLKQDLTERLEKLVLLLGDLQRYAPLAVKEYAGKLRTRIAELVQDQIQVDEQRLAAEIAIFADRSNVDEEITRLQSHFEQFGQLLGSAEPVGRKLDFLIQEMNREVNTIGSKANFTELTAKVIDMKAELEKMREQIQNIE